MISVSLFCLTPFLFTAPATAEEVSSYSLDAIHIRDPFILPVAKEGRYYLFGSHPPKTNDFPVYVSRDLKIWEGPVAAFIPPDGFWATRDFWAPEVHFYKGRYFLFASFKADKTCRGTQILMSETPQGPFRLHSNGPVTPQDWECLDGTLFVDSAGIPWIVFCHEWLQIGDGTICALRLSADLTKSEGVPITLFHASAQPLVTEIGGKTQRGRVTDGPFLYRMKNGILLMLWSSVSKTKYVQLVAQSETGTLTGPWKQITTPLFQDDGGHGMIFRTFEGNLKLILHRPNQNPDERALILNLEEKGDLLTIRP